MPSFLPPPSSSSPLPLLSRNFDVRHLISNIDDLFCSTPIGSPLRGLSVCLSVCLQPALIEDQIDRLTFLPYSLSLSPPSPISAARKSAFRHFDGKRKKYVYIYFKKEIFFNGLIICKEEICAHNKFQMISIQTGSGCQFIDFI